MPKTRKAARVRPPRTPKGEPLRVTLANQDKQIAMLIRRTEDLVDERSALRTELQEVQAERDAADKLAADVDRSNVRLQGWQDCARELLEFERTHIRIDRVKDAPF